MLKTLTILFALLTFSAPATAAPAIWKVSDADSSIWLFGSIHLLPQGTDWRTEVFDTLVHEAERVYFETDLGPAAQTNIIALTMQRGFAMDGRLLNQRIDFKLMSKVRTAAEELGVAVPTLLAMRPWMAASTISMTALALAGYDPQAGVDQQLTREIPVERQGFLETAEEQLDAVAGGTEDEQILMLQATLAEMPRLVSMIDDLMDAWLKGTPEALADLFLAEMGAYGEGFMDRLIVQRNRNWVVQIEDMLERNEKAFLIVGAGHLVGDYSVVTMLEEQGFTSERVQ